MKKLIFYTTTIAVMLSTHSAAASGTYTQQIKDLAGRSLCSSYSWKNRGRAPAGYIKGMALSFARSLCRVKVDGPSPAAAKILSYASTRNSTKDALSYYQSTFSTRGIDTYTAGESAVLAIYSLGIGLGMRESSGSYCEGWDVSAGSNRSSAQAEAGLFQVSYDSMGASAELKRLYQEYQGNPQRCHLNVFKEQATCKSRSILGTGAGASYQAFNKACPAFAVEYAMTMLRIQRSHFGPINRKEAEVVPVCVSLFKSVQSLVEADAEAVCEELY